MKLIINPKYREGVCNNQEHEKTVYKIGNLTIVFCDVCNRFWVK